MSSKIDVIFHKVKPLPTDTLPLETLYIFSVDHDHGIMIMTLLQQQALIPLFGVISSNINKLRDLWQAICDKEVVDGQAFSIPITSAEDLAEIMGSVPFFSNLDDYSRMAGNPEAARPTGHIIDQIVERIEQQQ